MNHVQKGIFETARKPARETGAEPDQDPERSLGLSRISTDSNSGPLVQSLSLGSLKVPSKHPDERLPHGDGGESGVRSGPRRAGTDAKPRAEGKPGAAASVGIGLEEACARAAAGDGDALQRLIVMHHPRLLMFVQRRVGVDWRGKIDPEDVLQETYASAWPTVGKFVYQGEDSFYQWLSRIADQRFIDRVRALRRKKRDAFREVGQGPPGAGGGGAWNAGRSRYAPLIEQLGGIDPKVSQVARQHEATAGVLAAMAGLPPDYRHVIGRLYLDNASVETVASEMGRTPDAIRRLTGRALAGLREAMGRQSRWV